jgi:anti-sigma regulatory factor (Ser/Thr protein kinase)
VFVVADENGISFEIPSVLVLVDPLVMRCEKMLRDVTASEATLRVVMLVMRELLNNAIKHGNGNIPQNIVRGSLRYSNRHRLQITVEDEGAGFDYQNINTRLPDDPRQLQQRGYVLVYSLAERVSFNESGNRVTATVEFDRKQCVC